MKTLLLITSIILFVMSCYFLNATNKYPKNPVTTGWIFNDTGNCDIKTVSA